MTIYENHDLHFTHKRAHDKFNENKNKKLDQY